jgi:RIP metalloprotease RseP
VSDSIDTRPASDTIPWPRATPPGDGTPPPPDDPADQPHLSPDQAWIAGGAGSGETKYGTVRLSLIAAAVIAGGFFFGPYVLIIIGALLISIVLHEFGHFFVARMSGMKATEFFVGFGPRLWSFRRGETEYGLKLIPAGAYVRIIGMNNLEEIDPADEPRSYRAQSAPKRVATVLAGPFMNLLIAFVLLFGIFLIQGRPSEDLWSVNGVLDPSAASEAGLLAGDTIVSVDGEPVGSFDDFAVLLDAKAGQQVDMVVSRDGQEQTLTPTLGWRLADEAAAAIPATPALDTQDIVTSIDGRPATTYDEFRSILAEDGDPVTVRIERHGDLYDLTVVRPLSLPEGADTGFLGVRPESTLVKETPLGALAETGRMMGAVTTGTLGGFGRLFSPSGLQNYAQQVADTTTGGGGGGQGTVEAHALRPVDGSSSPISATEEGQDRPISIVGIVQFGSGAAEAGWFELLSIVALVNIALALINLLPVLPFDGGHAVIGIYEGIRGKIQGAPYRADITKMMPLVYGVFGLLLLLGVSSILLDVLNPVSYGG